MLIGYQPGDRKRGGGNYDPKDQYSNNSIANQPYSGNYSKRGDSRYGEEPNSPPRSNAHGGNGMPAYESGGNKRRKEPINTVIVGTQQGATPISLTVSGAQNVFVDYEIGSKRFERSAKTHQRRQRWI